MKSLIPPVLCALTCLAAALTFASCASKGGDDGYTPPAKLSPVDATTRLQDQYRNWWNSRAFRFPSARRF